MNVGLIATAVWVSLEVLRRVVRRERDAALIGMAIAAHPLFLLNGARVANDALGVFLATLAIAASLSLVSRTDDRRLALHGATTGCLIGLAILAKATNYALVPFAAICWLIMLIRLRPKRMCAPLTALALGLGILVVVQSEVRFNLANYGSLSSMQEVLVNQRRGKTTTDLLRTASAVDWPRTVSQLWDRELFFVGGWSFMRSHPRVVMVYRDLVKVGMAAWLWLGAVLIVRRRDLSKSVFSAPWVPMACIALVLSSLLDTNRDRGVWESDRHLPPCLRSEVPAPVSCLPRLPRPSCPLRRSPRHQDSGHCNQSVFFRSQSNRFPSDPPALPITPAPNDCR